MRSPHHGHQQWLLAVYPTPARPTLPLRRCDAPSILSAAPARTTRTPAAPGIAEHPAPRPPYAAAPTHTGRAHALTGPAPRHLTTLHHTIEHGEHLPPAQGANT